MVLHCGSSRGAMTRSRSSPTRVPGTPPPAISPSTPVSSRWTSIPRNLEPPHDQCGRHRPAGHLVAVPDHHDPDALVSGQSPVAYVLRHRPPRVPHVPLTHV